MCYWPSHICHMWICVQALRAFPVSKTPEGTPHHGGVAVGVDGQAPVDGGAQALPHALHHRLAADVAVLHPRNVRRAWPLRPLPYLQVSLIPSDLTSCSSISRRGIGPAAQRAEMHISTEDHSYIPDPG